MANQIDVRNTSNASLLFIEEVFNSSNNCYELPANPVWIEPSNATVGGFDKVLTQTPRTINSPERRPQQGVPTDQTVTNNYQIDVTLESMMNKAPGIFLMRGHRIDVMKLNATTVDPSNNQITLDANPTASQVAAMPSGSLLILANPTVNNYQTGSNRKLHAIDTAPTTSSDDIEVSTAQANMYAESGVNIRVSSVGRRFVGSETNLVWNLANGELTFNFTGSGNAHGLAAMGLQIGMEVLIGSPDFLDPTLTQAPVGTLPGASNFKSSERQTVFQNGYQNTAANDMVGFVVVKAITDSSVVFSSVPPQLRFNSSSASTNVDLLFGCGFQDVSSANALFKDPRYRYELGTRSNFNQAYDYEYIQTAVMSQFSKNYPQRGLASYTVGFTGTSKTEYTAAEIVATPSLRQQGTANPEQEVWSRPFASGGNVNQIGVTNMAGSEFFNGINNVTITADNGRQPIPTMQSFEPQGFDFGNFNFVFSGSFYFTSVESIRAIEAGQSAVVINRFVNQDGMYVYRIPKMNLNASPRTFTPGRSITQQLNGQALDDNVFNQAASENFLPVPMRL